MGLAMVYSLSGFQLDLYDPFIHSLTLGFIGTMMLAHGPVILPGVLKRKFNERKLTMLPLLVLTLSVVLRAGGDLLMLVSYSAAVRLIVGLSGWLVLVAVLLFLSSIVRGILEPAIVVDHNRLAHTVTAN
jgi:small-conductance mechanosensitive channel